MGWPEILEGFKWVDLDKKSRPKKIKNPATMKSKYDKAFLLDQIASILQFYASTVADTELGGFNNQLRDDGTV